MGDEARRSEILQAEEVIVGLAREMNLAAECVSQSRSATEALNEARDTLTKAAQRTADEIQSMAERMTKEVAGIRRRIAFLQWLVLLSALLSLGAILVPLLR